MVEPLWVEVTFQKLSVPNLPQHWMGKRLVQISDLHVGRTNQKHLLRAMQQVNSLEPDLLVITGDFVDRHYPVDDRLVAVLEALAPAKVASLACLGNHDFGKHWSQLKIADEITSVVQQHGIRVLRNEIENIDGIDFSGLEDLWSPLRTQTSAKLSQPSDCFDMPLP